MKFLRDQLLKPCPHCEPTKTHDWHLFDRLIDLVPWSEPDTHNYSDTTLRSEKRLHLIWNQMEEVVYLFIIRLLITGRILTESKVHSKTKKVSSRTRVIIQAAKLRSVEIKPLTLLGVIPIEFFSYEFNNQRKIFKVLPHYDIEKYRHSNIGDKLVFKNLLKNHNLPQANGKICNSYREALKYFQTVNRPVVIKPRHGSLSRHVTVNIRTATELNKAVKIAQIISKQFIIEDHVPGSVFRVTLVDKKFVACCQREPANVVGDGVKTIQELIREKNSDPNRGQSNDSSYTLHQIQLSSVLYSTLDEQNLTLDHIPKPSQKIYLHQKVNLAAGSDIHDTTEDVHPDTISLCEKVAGLDSIPIIGLDLICENISSSYTSQPFAILEANTLPYIDMHHYPTTGQPRDVAAAVVEHWFFKTKTSINLKSGPVLTQNILKTEKPKLSR